MPTPAAGQRPAQAISSLALNERIAAEVERAAIPKTALQPEAKIQLKLTFTRPPFQLPFHCGQTWRASTYDGHYPDQDSLDLLRFDGPTNISANEDVLASAAGTVIEATTPIPRIHRTEVS